jgi:hypothetical protein
VIVDVGFLAFIILALLVATRPEQWRLRPARHARPAVAPDLEPRERPAMHRDNEEDRAR